MQPEEGLARLRALGFIEGDAESLWEHFDDAERRGKSGHGHARIPWLEQLEGYDPEAAPIAEEDSDSFWRYRANGAIGYLVLRTATHWCIQEPPEHIRLVVCEDTFPTGMLSHYTRLLADAGLVSLLTTTSPRRLGHPDGGPKLASTSPLSIGIPSSGGDPVVADVSMAAVTWGDVVAGLAAEDDVVPFGGDKAHKAFALAVALQLFVDALKREDGYGAVLLVGRPESDPVPALRELAAGVRLPGDS
ncbi:MAG TPA: Ldh family oxidoreductase [Gaiellaceae bacterium]|nr:Ldh family oxidoreductase [Gaiellaceae bacterium]